MNNEELLQQFTLVAKTENPLDAIVALKKLKKVYKKSDFFKQTKLSIDVAFKCYKDMISARNAQLLNEYITDTDKLVNKLNNVINNMDSSIFGNLLDRISGVADTEELRQMGVDLKEQISLFTKAQ